MGDRTGIPRTVYQVLYPCKNYFRCAQAQHCLVCCWLAMALIREPGKGTLKGLGAPCLQISLLGRRCGGSVRASGMPRP
jgi:hypothetical protein